jgi:hypothetical protein
MHATVRQLKLVEVEGAKSGLRLASLWGFLHEPSYSALLFLRSDVTADELIGVTVARLFTCLILNH